MGRVKLEAAVCLPCDHRGTESERFGANEQVLKRGTTRPSSRAGPLVLVNGFSVHGSIRSSFRAFFTSGAFLFSAFASSMFIPRDVETPGKCQQPKASD